MTTEVPPARRLWLALDATLACHEALEAAADLAHLMHAELNALFLEDQDLMAMADLPCALEICLQPRPGNRSLVREDSRRTWRQAAENAEQDFMDLLERKQLKGHFQTVQGRRRTLLDTPREQGDLLWFNYRSPLTRYPGKLPAWRETLYVLATNTSAGQHALALGLYLLGRGFQRLCVLHAPGNTAALPARPDIEVRLVPDAALEQPATLLNFVENRRSDALLLPDDIPLAQDREQLLATMGPLRTEVLLVH